LPGFTAGPFFRRWFLFIVMTESELRERLPLADSLDDARDKADRLAENTRDSLFIFRAVQRRKAIKTIEEEDLCQG